MSNRVLVYKSTYEEVWADEPNPDNGNASHEFTFHYFDSPTSRDSDTLYFQEGPISEVGVNGVTNEAVIAAVKARLEGFQSSPYACEENAVALAGLQMALEALEARTKRRKKEGVEGTHKLDKKK